MKTELLANSSLQYAGAWDRYSPTEQNPWDLKKVSHLHRRAGFGASWKQLQRDLLDGPDLAIGRIVDATPETREMRDVLAALRNGILQSGDKHERLTAYWLYRILFHPDQLQERMTLFWHSHFATSNEKVQSEELMLRQNELFRQHALGNISDLLAGVLVDPAMLIWLDGANSPKERPNENLARELLELFTLGVGNYSEQDIREIARALTGWTQSARNYGTAEFQFDQQIFDNGSKTILGQTGPWQRDDVVRIALQQTCCAEFLCRKLYRHFIRDDGEPAPELIGPLARELRTHDYSISHVIGIILRSRHFYDESNRRQRIAGPVELSVGLLRALDIPIAQIRLFPLARACESQGQQLFYPPNVAGWPGGKRWVTSSNMLERTNWLTDVIWGNPASDLPPFDSLAWMERNGVQWQDAAQVLVDLLLQGDLSISARKLVHQTVREGDANSLRKLIQILTYCPEYQLI